MAAKQKKVSKASPRKAKPAARTSQKPRRAVSRNQTAKAAAKAVAKPTAVAELDAGKATTKSAAGPAVERGAKKGGVGKYVYCIIEAAEPVHFGMPGIGSAMGEVHTVNYNGLAAVVSD